MIYNKKSDLSYFKILSFFIYIINNKEIRNGKMDFQVCKSILMGYDLLNNYFIYIPINKKMISIRDIEIREDLVYLD